MEFDGYLRRQRRRHRAFRAHSLQRMLQSPTAPDLPRDLRHFSAPSTPSASIELEDAKGVSATLMFDGVSEHASLKRGFVVFDSAVAERHLTDTGPLGFTPTGFDVFAEIARGYTILQSMLTADIQCRKRRRTIFTSPLSARRLPHPKWRLTLAG